MTMNCSTTIEAMMVTKKMDHLAMIDTAKQ